MTDVKTPLGAIPKPMAILAIVAGFGALGYSYIHKKNKASQAAASANSQASTDSTNAVNSPDGSTGYDYGAYTYDPTGYGYGSYGLGSYGDSSGYYGDSGSGYYNAGVPVPVPQAAQTNAQWVQAAISALTGQGFTGTSLATALGAYVTGQPLTADQESVVTAAIGAEGYPPVDGNNGYPPLMKPAGSTSGSGTTATQVAVPNVVGKNFGQAFNAITNAGLISEPGHDGANASHKVTAQSVKAGTKVNKGTVVKLTVATK